MKLAAYIAVSLAIIIQLSSCRSTRPVVTPAPAGEPGTSYIERYSDLAVSEMRRTGIPASITLAQGMIESDYGRSRLAREANNHFGIKCHDDWNGPVIRHHDDRRNECFRKYRRPEESFYDHSEFLKNRSRYASLFELSATDYKGWARGLKKAGYATNPDYANMLIRKIEEYNLNYFDTGYKIADKTVDKPASPAVKAGSEKQSGETANNTGISTVAGADQDITFVMSRVPRIMENNRIQYIIVKEGETAESIEEDFNLLKWELARYNEFEGDFTLTPGQILYLQPKRSRAEPGREVHIASEGETMYLISQIYGVKLYKLREYNRMQEGDEPSAGQRIRLRSAGPVK
ncbi:MAG TPA: glucosaminidase domain-containing protein [Bacteroidales bacterium]|nr:glucosaminidase domain-containing protein [Bacteroidales bacterium]HPF02838.1 glucosaminidase domain-containing protein [Bacteroidales bacterium]HPJ60238.1 glucosaminidase domain-containing protein [Bacteroidales bacterium]HPR13439.1 glucosaminidase domain-containing protein [Bacteroidales bacterium]HRW86383.1 glucosaminidase domain-containing protein [Bacteroidales bacterium]